MQLTVIKFVLFVLVASLVKSQIVPLDCEFVDINGDYICNLRGITLGDNENQSIAIGGDHLPERDEFSVTSVVIEDSDIPFIITQIFTTFPYLDRLTIRASGLQRIQPYAFANAYFLHRLHITYSPELRHLPANSFHGAWSIQELEIAYCGLESIHEDAFDGLAAIYVLALSHNNIRQLPPNVFRPLYAMELFFVFSNQIESLDGRLFEANPWLTRVDFSNNQIDAVGRNFFDPLILLAGFAFNGNICADAHWNTGGEVTVDTIREALETCFINFENLPKVFTMELHGTLIIRHENGTEIVTMKG